MSDAPVFKAPRQAPIDGLRMLIGLAFLLCLLTVPLAGGTVGRLALFARAPAACWSRDSAFRS